MRVRRRLGLGVLAAALALGALALGGGEVAAAGSGRPVGAVYVQTNTPANEVQVFYRSAQGRLTQGPLVPTGGDGSLADPPLGLALTDSDYSVVLTQGSRDLLVTNNGSRNISSFRVQPGGNITLADVADSHGSFPNSVAATSAANGRTLVYVLNEGSESVDGFWLGSDGRLTYIPGSERSLSGSNSASVAFDPSGRVLTVTNRNDPVLTPNGTISTFTVDPTTGLLGPEVVTDATGTGAPFGLDYTQRGQLLVANSGVLVGNGASGSATSYDLATATGGLTPVDVQQSGPLSITCWVRVTNDSRYGYFTNPGDQKIDGYRITSDGHLVPIGSTTVPTEASGDQAGEGSPLDLDFSVDGRDLYVLVTNIDLSTFAFGNSRIAQYAVGTDGSLTLIGVTPAGSGGNSGLAAY